MHEMALAEGIIEQVEATARQEQASRVAIVVVEIGKLAAVEIEALRFCFAAVASAGPASAARLEVIETAGRGRCRQCAVESPIDTLYDSCPACGAWQMEVLAGKELRVREIAIE